jgi:hypothetical protein
MEKIEKNRLRFGLKFENLKYVTKIWNEKTEIFHFVNLEFFIFEIWNEKFCLFFLKKFGHITKWEWKNNWNEKIIYFVYATEIKLSIIPLYHSYHLCIPPYTTCASCGGIQLILAIGSLHTGPFPTVVWGDMVHCKRALGILFWVAVG